MTQDFIGVQKIFAKAKNMYNFLFRQKANSNKNRYTDVLCYDYTRVILKPIDNDPTTDFINASYVNSYQQKLGYIACQGPLQKTGGDFWRMIWQENVRVIVMTTK